MGIIVDGVNLVDLLLICGCGHTGSSILARILGNHSDVYLVPRETGVFLANRYYLENEYIKSFEEDKASQGKRLILEKTPRHIWHVDYIRREFPKTKFILTTRDGRDVITSIYNRTKDFKGALCRYKDDSILTLRQVDQSDCMLVYYEYLTDNSSKYLQKICRWVGLNFEDEMLNYHNNPIEWNIKNPFRIGKPLAHDILRKEQLNRPLEKPSVHWSDKLPHKYHDELNEFFAKDNIGFRIMKDLGYEI